MNNGLYFRRNTPAAVIYNALNPIPYGFFVAALVFDIIYVYSTNVMWAKSASWLIVLGLIAAIIPRLINLAWVCTDSSYRRRTSVKTHFWLNVIAIIFAVLNSFIHSRDAYAIVPLNVIYSAITVFCLLIANIFLFSSHSYAEGSRYE